VARVRLGRVRPPEDDEVGPVLHLAERAGHLADALERHAARPVADRGGRIDAAADAVGDGDGDALRLAGRVGKAVDDRVARLREDARRPLDRLVERRGLPFDGRHGAILDVVVEEPRLAEDARVLGLGDVVVLDGQFHVVADAAAERAGGVFDDLEVGHGNPTGFWIRFRQLRSLE
jgi:hypothetical protein